MTIAGSRRGALVALAAVAALAAVVEWLVGWGALARAWASAGALVVPALGLLALSYLARAWRFQRYFGERLAGRFGAVLRVSVVHNLTNYVMPMRTGEAAFPLMMKREFGIALVSGTAALAWFRLLDLCVLAATGIALARLASFADAGSVLQAAGLGGFALCVAMPWVVFHFGRIAAKRLGPPGESASFFHRLVSGLPASPGTVTLDFAATFAIWLLKVLAVGILLEAFTGAPLARATIGALSGELTGALPLPIPAGLGTYEAGIVGVLALSGIDAKAALAAAVNGHLLLIAFAIAAGGLGLLSARGKPEPEPGA